MPTPAYISSLAAGDSIETDPRDPLDLSSAKSAYWVLEGTVDLFFVNRQQDDHGFRDYCTSFTEGDMIWPMPNQNNITTIAVGNQGTKLIPLDITQISALSNSDALSADIDHWLTKITAGILDAPAMPKQISVIEQSSTQTLEAGTTLSTSQQVLWLNIKKDEYNFCDTIDFDSEALSQFPITTNSWVTIPEEDTYLLNDTDTLIEQALLTTELPKVHSLLLDVYQKKFLEQRQQEEKLLEKSIRERKSDRATAFKGLSNVIEEAERHKESFSEARQQAPLLKVLDRIIDDPDKTLELPDDTRTDSFSVYLNDILRHNDLRSRQISLRENWWQKQSGSMLGFHGSDQQPVALISNGNTYEIHNPAEGTVTTVDADNTSEINKVAYNIYLPFPNKELTISDLLQFSFKNVKSELWTIGAMGLLASTLGLLTPILIGYIFDHAIPDSSYSELLQVSIALMLAAFASVAFQATRNISLLRFEGKTDVTLQAGIWDRILKLPSNFFRQFSAGELAERANSINAIRQLMAGATVTTLLSSIFNTLNLFLLFWYAPLLGWIACGLLALALLVLSALVWYRMKYQWESRTIAQKLAGTVQQLLSGIAKIKTTGSEGSAMLVWAKKFGQQVNDNYRIQKNQNWAAIFMSVYPILTSGIIFYFVGSSAHHLQLSTGTYLAFSAAFTTLLTTITTLTQTAEKVTQSIVLYEKSKPILKATPEVDGTKKSPGTLQGQIELKSVDFRYLENSPLVLRDVSFTADPGDFLAIVGPSGSGKSTLFRLMLGFEQPSHGHLFYDDQNLEDLDVNRVRRQFGVVLQEAQLMAGTLYRNIVGSKTELSIDDAWEAAEKVGLSEDIEAMPMGMHTMVSENGGNISGGQKQRLMIARAIIQRPNILLMDEATSALDNHTQKLVSESLDHIKATRIVIAHRLSTIKNADNIIVLKEGRVQEQGTYEQLMRNDGLFAELANRQIA